MNKSCQISSELYVLFFAQNQAHKVDLLTFEDRLSRESHLHIGFVILLSKVNQSLGLDYLSSCNQSAILARNALCNLSTH